MGRKLSQRAVQQMVRDSLQFCLTILTQKTEYTITRICDADSTRGKNENPHTQKCDIENCGTDLENSNLRNKVAVLQKRLQEKSEAALCTICYRAPNSHITSCGHAFCEECILKWVSEHQRCPYCREIVSRATKVYAVILVS